MTPTGRAAIVVVSIAVGPARPMLDSGQAPSQPRQHPLFASGVNLVMVPVTVTDGAGRAVTNLRREDFEVLEDGRPQPVQVFANERLPISLGVAVDTSRSMRGAKAATAREAVDRLIEPLAPPDEVFLLVFRDEPRLLQPWTTHPSLARRALARAEADGGTALYDAMVEAVALCGTGHHPRRALVVISDGNDTSSHAALDGLRSRIREADLLVYAIGLDADASRSTRADPPRRPPTRPGPVGGTIPPMWPPGPPAPPRIGIDGPDPSAAQVDAEALRSLTDDSGGRTIVIRSLRDLPAATSDIARELSQQYLLAYRSAAPRDGRWHTIQVIVGNPEHKVRSRRGYVAS